MNNISFVIFTYNEEKRISYVIKNFIKHGEVLIMDGGSTDKTQEVAEQLGAKFFSRPSSGKVYVENQEIFNFVKEKINSDYIYWGYADNIAPKTLLEKMIDVANKKNYKIIYIPLYTYLWGNTKNFVLKIRTPFLFHKNFMDFSDNLIHGMGKFTGDKKQILKLPNKEKYALRHFSTYNIDKFVQAHLRYAEEEAREMFNSGIRFKRINMLFSMAKYFFIWGRFGIKNKSLSLIVPLNYAFFRAMVYSKLFELENKITLDSIEENYSKKKEEMLGK